MQKSWTPGDNRLCELVGHAGGKLKSDDVISSQVFMLAIRLHFSAVLVTGEWDASLQLAEDEYTAAVEYVREARREGASRRTQLSFIATCFQGLVRDLQAARDGGAAAMVRFRVVPTWACS